MTHSYLVRAWALEHMHRGVLGRGVIADSCNVAPKTVTSWFRASGGRGPSLLKTHREYIRAIAILLYERFPQNLEQITKELRITPRILLDWRMQVRSPRYQSELIWATRLALVCLHDRISEYFDIEHDQLLLLQNKFPDSGELETMVFAVYDRNLKNNISMAAYAQYKREEGQFENFLARSGIKLPPEKSSKIFTPVPKRINGAHRFRGAIMHEDGKVEFEHFYQSMRDKYSNVFSHLAWLTHSDVIKTSEMQLQELLLRLKHPRLRKIRYQMQFGKTLVSWSRHDALLRYVEAIQRL